MTARTYVTYIRVSTQEQGRSGLGLEAQQRDIDLYLGQHPHEVLGSFVDIASGSTDDRPEFQKALKLVKETGAELLVAKLDRLSRDVAMIANLMKDKGVNFRIASMPTADKFSLHIYAALAEQERDMISLRTKASLAAASRRGVKLGGLRNGGAGLKTANAKRSATAKDYAEKVATLILPLRRDGLSLRAIAERLNEMKVATAGKGKWGPQAVKLVIDRVEGGI